MLDVLKSIQANLQTICDGVHYIFHPLEGAKVLFIKFAGASYWIALFIGISGIILYMCGHKKAAKYAPISVGAYAIIQSIASTLR